MTQSQLKELQWAWCQYLLGIGGMPDTFTQATCREIIAVATSQLSSGIICRRDAIRILGFWNDRTG